MDEKCIRKISPDVEFLSIDGIRSETFLAPLSTDACWVMILQLHDAVEQRDQLDVFVHALGEVMKTGSAVCAAIVAKEMPKDHVEAASDILQSLPFVFKAADFGASADLYYACFLSEFEWPKHARQSRDTNGMPTIRVSSQARKESPLLDGWKTSDGRPLEAFFADELAGVAERSANNCIVTDGGSGTRTLHSCEVEKALSVQSELSNLISKDKDESLSDRELRRRSILAVMLDGKFLELVPQTLLGDSRQGCGSDLPRPSAHCIGVLRKTNSSCPLISERALVGPIVPP